MSSTQPPLFVHGEGIGSAVHKWQFRHLVFRVNLSSTQRHGTSQTQTQSQSQTQRPHTSSTQPLPQRQTQGSQSDLNFEVNEEDVQDVLNTLTEVAHKNDSSKALTEVQVTILTDIRDAMRGIVNQLVLDRKPKSIFLKTEKVVFKGKNKTPKTIKTSMRCNVTNLRPLAVKVRILEIIFQMILTRTYATKRDIYYKHKQLFGVQTNVDRVLTDICAFLNADRYQLNVLSASRGSLIGPMTIETPNGQVDCRITPISIVQNFVDFTINFEARVVLVVEKDTIFQRLIEEGFRKHFPDILLVTGCGFPDFVTRQFLKRLETEFKIPIYALVDCDPHGLHIVLTYKYGSIRSKSQIEGGHAASTIPSIQMIGLRPSHLEQYHNPFQEIPFVRSDITTINLVKRRARELGDQSILREALLLAESKVKVELEALVAYSPQFLIQYIKDCQKQMPWVLHNDSIPKSTPFARKSNDSVTFADELP